MPKKKPDSAREPKKDIRDDVKIVLSEFKSKLRVTQVRVVHWIVEGKDTGPKIEKREFHVTQDGLRLGKCVGFKGDDIKNIVSHWDEISMFF